MPNLAAVFKSEITRLARRELRGELDALRKTVGAHRSDIANLRRQVQALEKSARLLEKGLASANARGAGVAAPALAPESMRSGRGPRFSAQGLADHRGQLGISAAQYGHLVGTTGQSVYAWEQGRSVPRAAKVALIAELRSLGKRAVAAKLAALSDA